MSARLIVVVTLLAASAFALPARAQEDPSWRRPFEPFRVIGNIHYVGTEELAAYLITTPDGHILLDGVLPDSTEILEGSIRALGFRVEDIKYLLNSQAHFDHVGSLGAMKERSGGQVLVMAGDEDLVAAGGKGGFLLGDRVSFPPVRVDRVLRDGDTVTLGGTTLTAHHTPGHTPGCTTWTTIVDEGGRTYRVVFPGSTTILPGMKLIGTGLREQFERTFRVLEALEADVFLGAHASFFDLAAKRARQKANAGSNPFIDPASYREFIARKKKDFEAALRSEQGAGH